MLISAQISSVIIKRAIRSPHRILNSHLILTNSRSILAASLWGHALTKIRNDFSLETVELKVFYPQSEKDLFFALHQIFRFKAELFNEFEKNPSLRGLHSNIVELLSDERLYFNNGDLVEIYDALIAKPEYETLAENYMIDYGEKNPLNEFVSYSLMNTLEQLTVAARKMHLYSVIDRFVLPKPIHKFRN